MLSLKKLKNQLKIYSNEIKVIQNWNEAIWLQDGTCICSRVSYSCIRTSIFDNMDSEYSCVWHDNLYHSRNFTMAKIYLSGNSPTIHVTITYNDNPCHKICLATRILRTTTNHHN
jgi:hypothetical protein